MTTPNAKKKTVRTKKKAAKKQPKLEIRPGVHTLLFLSREEVKALSKNPWNWRDHSERQRNATVSTIKENNWADTLLLNDQTKRLIDGHGRQNWIDELPPAPAGGYPVLVGSWNEEQERSIIQHLDPISAMAGVHAERLHALNEQVKKDTSRRKDILNESKEQFTKITKELEETVKDVQYGAPAPFFPSDEDIMEFERPLISQPDQVNPSSASITPQDQSSNTLRLKNRDEIGWDDWDLGAFDIPNLLPERLPSLPGNLSVWIGPETPTSPGLGHLYIWGSAAVEKVKLDGMVVCFYTEDYKFESVWSDPRKFTQRLLNYGVTTIVSPNFSCYRNMHYACDIWQTYRSRWLARYFQEAGFNVIPDVCAGNLDRDEVWNWRLAGIPKGIPAIAMEFQHKGGDDPAVHYQMQKMHLRSIIETLGVKSLLAYCAPILPKNFFDDLPLERVLRVNTFMSERSKIIESRAKTGEYLSNASADKTGRKSKRRKKETADVENDL